MSIIPFNLTIEPLRKLLVINVLGDNEVIMIEPQIYRNSENRDLLRVLMYRKDKKVDVYFQKGLVFDPDKFSIGEGLGHYGEVGFLEEKFEIDQCGVDLRLKFYDKHNRLIDIVIKETIPTKSRFPFLAPVGKDISNPDRFFLVDMLDFGFVKRDGTFVQIMIDGISLKLENFPIPFGGKKVYFARYSSKLLIGEINASLKSFGESNLIATVDGTTAEIRFDVPTVGLDGLNDGESKEGRWEYLSDSKKITGGFYCYTRRGEYVDVLIDVCEKWKPGKLPIAFTLFTKIVSSFRTWPTLYQWKGSVDLRDLSVKGGWHKKK